MLYFFTFLLFSLSIGGGNPRTSSFIQYPAEDATSDVYVADDSYNPDIPLHSQIHLVDLKDPFISDQSYPVGAYPRKNEVFEVTSSGLPGGVVYPLEGGSYVPLNQGFTVQAEPVAPFISETIVAPNGYGFLTQPEGFLPFSSPAVNLRPEIHLVEITDNYGESPYTVIDTQQPYPPRNTEYGVSTYGGDYGVATYGGRFNTPFSPQSQSPAGLRYVPLPYNPVQAMGLGRTRPVRPMVSPGGVPPGRSAQARFPQGVQGAGLGRVLPTTKEHDHSKNQEVVMFALGRVLGRLHALDNKTDTAPILQRLIELQEEDEVGTKPSNVNYPPWTIPPSWGGFPGNVGVQGQGTSQWVNPPPISVLGVPPNMGLPSIVPSMSYGKNPFQSVPLTPTSNSDAPWIFGNSPWADYQQNPWSNWGGDSANPWSNWGGDSANPWSNFLQTPKKESKPWWYELIPSEKVSESEEKI